MAARLLRLKKWQSSVYSPPPPTPTMNMIGACLPDGGNDILRFTACAEIKLPIYAVLTASRHVISNGVSARIMKIGLKMEI
jgi:hypothetical protein